MVVDTSPERRQDNVLRLPDGRMLGYAEYGDPDGAPVMFFHGLPGSRVSGSLGDNAACERGVRLIAPDRPGFGLSSFKRKRAILDWTHDVTALANALGIGRFAVGGVSGGGPYAAACAYALGPRLTGAAIVSGIAPGDMPRLTEGMMPTNRVLFGAARRLPPVSNAITAIMGRMLQTQPRRMMEMMPRGFPPADRAILERPGVRETFLEDIREAFRSGSKGTAYETRLMARKWGFRLRDIAMPVHLWQGEDDRNVPARHGRYQASEIPNCEARFLPGEGHLLVVDRIGEILDAVTGGSRVGNPA